MSNNNNDSDDDQPPHRSALTDACIDIWLLSRKNFKIQFRHRLATFLELIVPCLLVLMIAIIRTKVSVTEFNEPTIYDEFDLLQIPKILDQQPEFQIYFTPNTSQTNQIMENLLENLQRKCQLNRLYELKLPCHPSITGFENSNKMIDQYLLDDKFVLCGVEFEQLTNDNIKFSLRFSNIPRTLKQTAMRIEDWKTQMIMMNVMPAGPRDKNNTNGGQPGYEDEGFLFIQHLLSMAIGKTLFANDSNFDLFNMMEIELMGQRFPYPKYIDDIFLFSLNFLFPSIFLFSFYFSAINLTKTIVNEKEKRIKESMKMMGLKEKYHFIAYFIKSILLIIPAIILIIIFLKISFAHNSPPILITDSTILFAYFFLYQICNVCFCFMLSTFFSKANLAGILTGIISFLTYLPYFPMIQEYNNYTLLAKIINCLMPNTNMSLGVFIMLMRETRGIPITWNNISDPAIPDDSLTFSVILIMFVVNSLIYLIITWYITLAFPGEYGVPLPWYFPFTKKYWFDSNNNNIDNNDGNQNSSNEDIDDMDDNNDHLQSIESYPRNHKIGINIKNLYKTYDNGKTYSVKNLSFKVFENQITALLGHNGAGKTTTISLLCGLFPPTNGTAIINGYDIRTEMNRIRSSLGICPQSNLLFDELTVEEHLDFYCRLKHTNLTNEQIKHEIKQMVKKLDLKDKFHVQANCLSGGMKRKLSVGIALIGGSKIVILDEPTSGLDVSARRFIWDLLLQEKMGRVIIISTHFMEEADILGDRIAIMDFGSLRCYGSSLFLKKHFGAGYHLRMEKRSTDIDSDLIKKIVLDHIDGAKMESSVGIELTFSLPNEQISKFGALLRRIETELNDQIVNYGISITTMEEVFLKVGSHNQQKTNESLGEIDGKSSSASAINIGNGNHSTTTTTTKMVAKVKNSGKKLIGQQFYALLIKRILYSIRNPILTLTQFILPILILISTLLMMRSIPQLAPFRKLEMSLNQFHNPLVKYFVQNDSRSLSLANDYAETLMNEIHSDRIIAIPDVNETKIIDEIISVNNFVYNYEFVTSALFQYAMDSKFELKITAMFNDQPFHTPSISLRYIDQALLRHFYNRKNIQLSVSNYPMPLTIKEKFSKLKIPINVQGDFQVIQSIIMGLSFFLSSYAILIVDERISKAKHLQKISGLRMVYYWLSFLLCDFILYLLSIVSIIITLQAFKVDNLHEDQQSFYLFVGYGLCGLALIPFVYSASFFFSIPATAYARLSLLLILSSITSLIADQLTAIKLFDLLNINRALKPIFHLFIPLFDISKITSNLQTNYRNNKICHMEYNGISIQKLCKFLNTFHDDRMEALRPCCKDYCNETCLNFEENYFSLNDPGIGSSLLYVIGSAIIYWLALFLIEVNTIVSLKTFIELIRRKFTEKSEPIIYSSKLIPDDDVQSEKSFVNKIVSTGQYTKYSLVINNLQKIYGKFTAVDNISYCVGVGECFGLLGVNGAGKTTTFKMITGDESITSGDIFINGFDVTKEPYKTLGQIGYCPQFDALFDDLTGEEILRFYSRLRGIQEKDIDEQITELSQLLYFEMYLNKLSSTYSGGNKRKLSTAIALLGNPAVSFLDEPTSGVDPVARRCLWEAIGRKLKQNISIVLTSHSMEECEALCNRLIIMVNGQITCIGSPLHLKNKYGNSYNLILKVSQNRLFDQSFRRQSYNELEKKIEKIKSFMLQTFPTSKLKAIHNNQLEYIIQNQDDYILRCSEIFDVIETNKEFLQLEDYSVSQTNLEQIFLSFARKQHERLEDVLNEKIEENTTEENETNL
ncbi:phospholipid-transporting ATPase ABCA3-like [Dermatophagoides pteronyssinus]|uniref:phospholipid-transporting ATPase ABCA3-like n=1 Tax=Dermatophagoides pteronyssinus TaxID=6956 RepID=UPI003F669ED9